MVFVVLFQGASGGNNSGLRIQSNNSGDGSTSIIGIGTGSSPNLIFSNWPGYNFQSISASAGASDYYLNGNHAGTSGYLLSVLKQGTQKLAISNNAGQVGINKNWIGGATNYTDFELQVGGDVMVDNNVLIGGTSLTSTSILDVQSTTKGVLFPRMNTTQMNAISTPAPGS